MQSGQAQGTNPLPPGVRTVWADWQLRSEDPWGNLYLNVLSPYRPQ